MDLDDFRKTTLAHDTLLSLLGVESITGAYAWAPEWESIRLPEGYVKPSKEAFETKFKELVDAEPWNVLRKERNKRLAECDWVAIKALTTDIPVSDEWKAYMSSLRDLPANTTDPANPVWPTPPE